MINKLEAQIQGVGGFALKIRKMIGFDNLRVGILSYTKGASMELFHNLKVEGRTLRVGYSENKVPM